MSPLNKSIFAPRPGGTGALVILLVLAGAFAALSMAAQIEWPGVAGFPFSPIEMAVWLAMGVAVALTAALAMRRGAQGLLRPHWIVAVATVSALAAIEAADTTVDSLFETVASSGQPLEYLGHAAFAVIVAAALMALSRPPKGSEWLSRGIAAIVVLQGLAIVVEFAEVPSAFIPAAETREVVFTAELAELLCIEFYVVAVALTGLRTGTAARRGVMLARLAALPPEAIGAKMREAYWHGGFHHRCSHPPLRIAYIPVFREITLLAIACWLAAKAGPGVRLVTGIPVWRQAREMIALWFSDGIDPPTYYELELYRPERKSWPPAVLTRFETKNGMLSALNRMRPCPYPVSEMNHKQFFYRRCAEAGLPNPGVLAVVEGSGVTAMAAREALARDLFCKAERGMGAIGTMAFRYVAPGIHESGEGARLDLDGVFAEIARQSDGAPIMVQPWLRNHPGIADFARDSLVTFRVVTCLADGEAPAVALAMLRVLAKLEPRWTEALDEEYASPIDLETGRLGLFTGDNMTTSCLRYASHPLTGAPIEGRTVPMRKEIWELALRAHALFGHRAVVGWDIALTPEGPMLLEGNGNLDVMFLQRVHDVPAGRTRFGGELNRLLTSLVRLAPGPAE